MGAPFLLTLVILTQITSISSSFSSHGLTGGSSLSVENQQHLLVSPNNLFTAGFHQVGDNAYAFAVWFSDQTTSGVRTVVWMANRDAPVNGKQSKLSLGKDGNLVLVDAGHYVIWSTQTKATSSSLQLRSSGNLVLSDGDQSILWQSFDYPTDTLLPNQPFTKSTQLVSSRSSTNCSSGFYKLVFDNDSILRLLYDSPETTSLYWPDPRLLTWKVGRFQYINTRRASLDSKGEFHSSDGFTFLSADFGMARQRIMRMDTDGILRVYSLVEHERGTKWETQWQAIDRTCRVDGICGANSLCTYSQDSGRKCSCLHGFKMVNSKDWSYGCEPEFKPCIRDECDFIELREAEFYGYDIRMGLNYTLDACKKDCLLDRNCSGFNLGWKGNMGYSYCFMKTSLHNGYQNGVAGVMYIKLPKRLVSSFDQKTISLSTLICPSRPVLTPLIRSYDKKHDISKPLGYMLVLGCTIGIIEIICIVVFWYFSHQHSSAAEESYFPAPTAFRKFTYRELKKATRNFREDIGSGGASVVYRGRLNDNRIAAIKRLKNTYQQGEVEFQAEISTIGKVNHMNLIETWGYCAEGNHRLVVYEYMENGSLAENLGTGKLDWATRLDIATGTAKGLAYLHEECLEWVLHCDVKPHNILLDANYNPKVADFGLSRLFDRSGINQSNFSMVRGTRGYMAPEWVFNLPITSKVDVFSYGVVILEMITGRSPTGKQHTSNEDGKAESSLIEWVRERIQDANGESWVEDIIDPSIRGEYDRTIIENLVRIALHCTEEDRDARPSMSQVVDMIQDPR
ncbi:putative receptor protein kinase ZmPK1 [Cynara cardunculus var. scolymus]|uniref:Receptor-like serine/threonine-protein kinase n=1 Tax=Cynara cardunculus var. scolymus TaxID=59895 RepID=A0A103Y6D8_CYNCS|nr:putative receptor protein kinase ZmPK1 [Cynara cardunculus var. scolymus]KVI03351.1 Bulb-type lectin domain-containing protein [Cynara cardunculus var. scolymus]